MSKPDLRERAREELRNYALVASYLYVCFAAFVFYKSALLQEEGAGLLPHGLAATKALVLGKFILIGEATGVGTRVHAPRLIGAIASKSALFFLLLVVLSAVEELIVGKVHGHSVAATLAEYREHSVRELLAGCLLMLLVLVPLIGVKEIDRALGPGALWRLLFGVHPPRAG